MGFVSTLAGNGAIGNTNGTGTAARFNAPFGVAVDTEGTAYVADLGNNRIRKITPSGVVTTLAGSFSGYLDGIGTAAKFINPLGIAVAVDGTVFIAESGGSKIRKITATLDVNRFSIQNQIALYPNPASTIVHLHLNDLIVSEIVLLDLNGRFLKSKIIFNNESAFYIGDLPFGIYIMQITSDKGIIYKKIIKT